MNMTDRGEFFNGSGDSGDRPQPNGSRKHPPCPVCGGPVERRRGERPSKFEVRQSCSPKCAQRLHSHATAGRKRLPAYRHPPCECCGGTVFRYGSETRDRWINRRHCSIACRREAGAVDPGWPEITGSALKGLCFAAHATDPGDGGTLGILPPATHVATASTIGGK